MLRRAEMWVAGGIAALLCALPTQAQQQPVNLDQFLAGIERCNPGTDFDAFTRSIVDRFSTDMDAKRPKNDPKIRIVLPQNVSAAMGTPISQLESDTAIVRVPFKGIYQGLPVASLRFFVGRENGIFGYWVIFDAASAKIRRRYGASLAAAHKANQDGAGVTFMVAKREPGTIACDFSN